LNDSLLSSAELEALSALDLLSNSDGRSDDLESIVEAVHSTAQIRDLVEVNVTTPADVLELVRSTSVSSIRYVSDYGVDI
jgi:hypothetical protein